MPKAYSTDLRSRVVAARENGKSVAEIMEIFEVSAWCIGDWTRRKQETGSLKNDYNNCGRDRILACHEELLRSIVNKKPDATLEEIRDQLPGDVCISTVHYNLIALGITYKKNSIRNRAASA